MTRKHDDSQTQCQVILDYLRRGHHLTALTAMNAWGIFRLAARVHELRQAGHPIRMTMVRNPAGTKSYASYWLPGRG
jgi:hypothetical protein